MSKRFDLDVGKRRARRRLREFIKDSSIFNKKRGRVLCFPGEQGWEIEQVYRPLGIPDHNIYGVERDTKAAKGIRERYPNINLFVGDMMDFIKSYEGEAFTVVSLDYCGHMGQDKIAPIAMLEAMGKIAERAVVAINVMAGREDAADQAGIREQHAQAMMQPLFENGAVDVMDALSVLREAGSDKLSEARDNALTQSVTAALSYLIPSTRACYQFDLKHVRGHAIRIRTDTVALRDTDDGSLILKNAEVDRELTTDKIQLARQIKHEAIVDINKELEERGIIKAAHYEARRLGLPPSFLDYHLGRTLVMAWFDRWSQPSFPVRIDRISYVSDSGKRMLSDYIEVHGLTRELESLKLAVSPYSLKSDPSKHKFGLNPDPSSFPTTDDYLDFLKKRVYEYADLVGKFAQTDPGQWMEREDLGGGQALKVDETKLKEKVIRLVGKGWSTEEIATKVPFLSVGTIRAIRAHCTMNSYAKKENA